MVDNASRGQALDTNSRGHGSPYDRGAADSHYQRGALPHIGIQRAPTMVNVSKKVK